MRFVCDSCRAQYMISDEKVGAKGVKVRCKKCGFVILVRKTAQTAPPPPAPSDEGADATQVMQNPLTGSGTGQSAPPSSDPDVTAPGVAPPSGAGKSGSGLFAGVEEDEIGAVFDQVLQSGSHKVVASSEDGGDGGGSALGDESPDDRLSTRVLDVETVRKLAEETAQGGAGGSGAHVNGKNGKAPADTEPEKHEWFVAIDEKQVGPLALEKVKAHWDSGEIGPDSLCWRAGFSDWLPLSEVAELASVLAPQPKKPVIVGSGSDAAAAPGPAVVTVPVESAFSAGGVTRTVRSEVPVVASASGATSGAAPDAGGWKPSAASALASLVKEEIEALAKPPEPEVKAKPLAGGQEKSKDDGVKGLLDLPSAEHAVPDAAQARATSPRPSSSEPLQRSDTADFGRAPVGAAPYQTAYRPQSSGLSKPVVIGGGVVLALLVVLVVAVVALAFGRDGGGDGQMAAQPVQQPVAVAEAPKPAEPPAAPAEPAKTPEPPAATEPVKADVPDTGPAKAAAKEDPQPEPKKPEPTKVARRDPAPARSEPKPEPKRPVREERSEPANTTSPSEAADDFDAVFGGGSSQKSAGSTRTASKTQPKKNDSVYIPPAPGSATVPERLGQSDIMAVVLRNKAAIQGCVNEQKQKDPGTSGRLVMRWSIRTNGNTEKINVQTAEFRSTHVATCIGGLIKRWKFPAHQVQGDPIDFPFIF